MNLNWQWPNVVLFCVVALVLGGLVYTGKIPATALSTLLAWLVPSPLSLKGKAAPPAPPPAN